MTTENLSRLVDLFNAALDERPENRAAFLAAHCDDALVREQVEELLACHEAAFSYFDGLAGSIAQGAPIELELAGRPSIRIGAYRTVRLIGHGGMGSVFLAERADGQFDQVVALKLLRFGVDTEQDVRRFLAERQIVARLEHPNIARLLDGGVTDDGRPYFVMEYVPGRPLMEACDDSALTLDERLRLFLQVGDAVQYAHRHLVVHRDLKPSNILVTSDRIVKLVDFGIAKLLTETGDGEPGVETRTSERALTPAYAAPEQIRGGPITTATDVYALGAVLYELLTGRRPCTGGSTAEIERAVLEAEPERPSIVAPRFARRLRGDLDTICLTALRKEPARRYGSAQQLVDDVRRHLAGLPVMARDDTLRYRAAKFGRRHRFGVAAAALIALLVTGFAVAMGLQSARLARERDKARDVTALLADLFGISDPAQARGATVTAREVLDRGVVRVQNELGGQPEVQASLLEVVARVYQNLGLYDRAEPLLEQVVSIKRTQLGPDHPEVAAGLDAAGEVHRLQGNYVEAERLLREALALHRRLERRAGPATARSLNNLGKVLYARGAYGEAETVLREALAISRETAGGDTDNAAESLNNLAAVLDARGDPAAAEPLFRETVNLRRARLGPDHPSVAASLNNLASVLSRQGKDAEAERVYREALDSSRRVYGQNHPRVATMLNNLALVLYGRGDWTAAEPLFRESLAMRRQLLGGNHPDTAQSLANLGLLLQTSGRLAEAGPLYDEALTIRRQALGAEHPLVAQTLNNIGLLRQARGDDREAESLFRQALAMLRARLGPEHPLVATNLQNLAVLLHQKGDTTAAEPLYRDALAIRRKTLPAGHVDLSYPLLGLGRLLASRGEFEPAEPLLVEAFQVRERARAAGHPEIAEAARALATMYERWGRRDEAERYRTRARLALR